MVQYKLYYFDGRVLAEPIRLLFHYVGQQFEDVRIASQEEFETNYKSKFFYGKVPVLEVDGKQLGESTAILRYLGEKFGLAGKDEWEKAKANEIINFLKENHTELAPYLYVKTGFREGDLDKLRTEVFEPGVKRIFPLYVKLLEQSGSGFLLPSGLSIADFLVANILYTFTILELDSINAYPELVDYVKRVHGLPELKDYIEKRKNLV